MDQEQVMQEFAKFLVAKHGFQSEQELQSYLQQHQQDGILELEFNEFQQQVLASQLQPQPGQVVQAKHGAKLNYIKQLRGQCPDGYEVKYFKKGGTLAKTCVKCQLAMEQGGNIPQQDGNAIDAFKCGRKMKKKKEQGGNIPFEKYGEKPKQKKAEDGEVEMGKCGKQLKKSCGGSKMLFKANGGSFIPFPRKDLN